MASDDHLPQDMIFEVLSRTTLETLDTCKAVSKEWKNMIYDSTFLPTYLKRTNNLFGYIIQNLKFCRHISTFVPVVNPRKGDELCINRSSRWCNDTQILASCKQGILICCEKQGRHYRYYVGKPATRQWRSLPNPKLRYRMVAIGVVVVKSKPLHFKIVRLSEDKGSKMRPHVVSDTQVYNCEIFDSYIWAWRATQGVTISYGDFLTSHQPAISVGDFFYWQTNANDVLAFDVADEHFYMFSLPKFVCDKRKRLVEYEGGLGFTCLSDDKMELWQWRNKREWTSKIVVHMKHFKSSSCPVGFCNSDTAVMKRDSEIVFCKLDQEGIFLDQEGSFTRVNVNYDFGYGREVFPFQSDSERVDFSGGI